MPIGDHEECEYCDDCTECDFWDEYEDKCILEQNEEENMTTEETKKTDPLLESEIAKTVREKLKQIIGTNDEKLDRTVKDFIDRLAGNLETILQNTVRETVQKEWTKYIETATDGRIVELMKESLEKIIIQESGDKVVEVKIHTIILNRVKKFFQDQWDAREKRNKVIEENLERIINHTVDEKVNAAIQEIKEECIEKFQKAAMKKMMEGMAQAINQDKRLLELMTNPNL